jgi:cobalt-precorrin 5A hydrolase
MTTLIAGIGCRRDASAEQIEAAVRDALGALGGAHPFAAIGAVATLDSKAAEPGLLDFCARHTLPLHTFTRDEIAALGQPVSASPIVREHVGVDGVCEPCALLASRGGQLLVPKFARDGVTVAIACAAVHQPPNDTPRIKEHR